MESKGTMCAWIPLRIREPSRRIEILLSPPFPNEFATGYRTTRRIRSGDPFLVSFRSRRLSTPAGCAIGARGIRPDHGHSAGSRTCPDLIRPLLHSYQDWYGAYRSVEQTNPEGPVSGSDRSLRGGSYHHDLDVCRSATRNRNNHSIPCEYMGIRVVRRP